NFIHNMFHKCNDCNQSLAFLFRFQECNISFQLLNMRNYKRKTEKSTTPLDVMDRATNLVENSYGKVGLYFILSCFLQ
ncbi:hypothetical protein L9F63_011561, partial [Diploptera punctata]